MTNPNGQWRIDRERWRSRVPRTTYVAVRSSPYVLRGRQVPHGSGIDLGADPGHHVPHGTTTERVGEMTANAHVEERNLDRLIRPRRPVVTP